MYQYLGIDVASLIPVIIVMAGSGSILLFADVLDYAKGIFSIMISIAILRSIQRGKTGGFEHGVGRLSTLGTLFMSLIIGLSLFAGIGMAFYRLFHPVSIANSFTAIGAVFQLCGIGINCWLMMRNLKLARETHSPLLEATWRLAFVDMVFSAFIFVSLCLSLWFSAHAWSLYLDPVCAIMALAIGMGTYAPLLKKLIIELSDRSIAEDYHFALMRALSANFELYSDFHGVKTRYQGGRPHISVYLCFPEEITVAESLQRIAIIKAAIAREIEGAEIELIMTATDQGHLSSSPASQ
jgi:divalent metal cation (Fe/Co/Zn/Cd) transporter